MIKNIMKNDNHKVGALLACARLLMILPIYGIVYYYGPRQARPLRCDLLKKENYADYFLDFIN